MSTSLDDLAFELLEVQKARQKAQTEAMREYDASVYMPALLSIQERCTELGHKFGTSYHLNPFGYSWRSCVICGARTDVSGPQEQEELDEIKPVDDHFTSGLPGQLKNVYLS